MHSRLSLGMTSAFTIFLALSVPLRADEVSDALQAAADAYAAGDLATTGEQITMATQALGARQTALLVALLPAAPEGWTRTVTEDFGQGFAMAGGGSGAEARYDSADGAQSFTLSFIADNPMVGAMSAMLGTVQMMAAMGTVVKVGRQPLLRTDSGLSALVNARVLFQAQGAEVDLMLPLVQQIDFAKVGEFDKK